MESSFSKFNFVDQSQSSADVKENESPTAPKPSRRDLDGSNSATTNRRKVIPVDFDLKVYRRNVFKKIESLISISRINIERSIDVYDKQLDAEDEEDDEDYNEEFTVTRFEEEDEAANYWQLKEDYSFADRGSARNRHKDHRDDDEASSANPWRKTGGLRLTRNEYHRFCDAQLECNYLAAVTRETLTVPLYRGCILLFSVRSRDAVPV